SCRRRYSYTLHFARGRAPVVPWCFDLLHPDGRDLRRYPSSSARASWGGCSDAQSPRRAWCRVSRTGRTSYAWSTAVLNDDAVAKDLRLALLVALPDNLHDLRASWFDGTRRRDELHPDLLAAAVHDLAVSLETIKLDDEDKSVGSG